MNIMCIGVTLRSYIYIHASSVEINETTLKTYNIYIHASSVEINETTLKHITFTYKPRV